MNNKEYPGVFARVKAVTIDGVILLIMMVTTSSIFSNLEYVPDYERIIAFIIIFILYDPLLTSTMGGTLGHRFIGIRVKKASDETSNINIVYAIIRFLIKGFFGWISLLTVMGNDKRKAIHDYVAQSVVIYK
jgi:uncharacterized RDD family membrane protein YckC